MYLKHLFNYPTVCSCSPICITGTEPLFCFLQLPFIFIVPPVISSRTKSYSVAVDGSVTLQCETEGYPTPSVSWYKDGKPLFESVRQRVLSSGSLHIVFAQPGDMGIYTCTAANVAGSLSLEMSVTVLSESHRNRLKNL